MVNKNRFPKWSTPDRRAVLVELWRVFGNRCLLGHTLCFDASHYIHFEARTAWASKPVYLPCLDTAGNPIKGKYLKLYKPVKVAELEASFKPLYEVMANQVIGNWKDDDRETRKVEYRLESIALHMLGEPRYPLRGTFSAISKEIYGSNQPLFYLQGLGMSGVTLKPFAKVRLSSSYLSFYIDLGDTLRGVSKNKRRKALRYGKPLPMSIENMVSAKISEAVRDYLAH